MEDRIGSSYVFYSAGLACLFNSVVARGAIFVGLLGLPAEDIRRPAFDLEEAKEK